MSSEIKLKLDNDELKRDTLLLIQDCNDNDSVDPERYERENDISNLVILYNNFNGKIINISLEEFTSHVELAVKMLRDYPLPWIFSITSMNIKEKPLEDILLAILKKTRKRG